MKKNTISKFWLGSDDYESLVQYTKKKEKNLLQLSQYKKAISNFVDIVTGLPIPVKFNASDESYTDGSQIVIGANLSDSNFDPVVGLALHEASHIKLTDFNAIAEIPVRVKKDLAHLRDLPGGQDEWEQAIFIKDLINYIEDRRIDYFIYSTSPGYKGYYHSLYKKYFQSTVVTKALATDQYTSETYDSYAFRIFNFVNKNRDLTALNGLREIWDLLDLKNISRLSHTFDSVDLAFEIYEVIARHIDVDEEAKKQKVSQNKPKDEEREKNSQKLSNSQKSGLSNHLEKQRDFLRGNIKKTKLNKKESQKMKALESSGVTQKSASVKGLKDWDFENGQVEKVPVIIINNPTVELAKSNIYPEILNSYSLNSYHDIIHEGFSAGRVLAKKLKIVNEEKDTKHSRLLKGKIDKRLIHQFGFGGESNFYKTVNDKYKKSICHISIDASGSMWGSPFQNAIRMAITTAVAAKLSNNIDIVISFRTTHEVTVRDNRPVILIGYDSRKDSLAKIKEIFPYINCGGLTPEGLCFDAIKEQIMMTSDNSYNKYFINLSDGLPNAGNNEFYYAGEVAWNHTAKVTKSFKAAGVGVLSYFVAASGSNSSIAAFKAMYGKSSRFIDVSSINSIAKTLNSMFLLHSNKVRTVC